ncbi:hypothetical protein MTO96_018694 [Rhipicephalus appendiculatus]
MQNSETENRGPEGTQLCKYCQRRVKEFNMPRHEENCTKAPKPCVYCDRMFLPDKMPMHHKECDQNPGNVPEGRRSPTNVPEYSTELGCPIAKLLQQAKRKALNLLQQGDTVRVSDDDWSREARVLQEVAPRSHIVDRPPLLQAQPEYHGIDDVNSTSGNNLRNERQEHQHLQHGPSVPGFSGNSQARAHEFCQGKASQAEPRRSSRPRKEPQRLQYDANFDQVSNFSS